MIGTCQLLLLGYGENGDYSHAGIGTECKGTEAWIRNPTGMGKSQKHLQTVPADRRDMLTIFRDHI